MSDQFLKYKRLISYWSSAFSQINCRLLPCWSRFNILTVCRFADLSSVWHVLGLTELSSVQIDILSGLFSVQTMVRLAYSSSWLQLASSLSIWLFKHLIYLNLAPDLLIEQIATTSPVQQIRSPRFLSLLSLRKLSSSNQNYRLINFKGALYFDWFCYRFFRRLSDCVNLTRGSSRVFENIFDQ